MVVFEWGWLVCSKNFYNGVFTPPSPYNNIKNLRLLTTVMRPTLIKSIKGKSYCPEINDITSTKKRIKVHVK